MHVDIWWMCPLWPSAPFAAKGSFGQKPYNLTFALIMGPYKSAAWSIHGPVSVEHSSTMHIGHIPHQVATGTCLRILGNLELSVCTGQCCGGEIARKRAGVLQSDWHRPIRFKSGSIQGCSMKGDNWPHANQLEQRRQEQ